MSPNKIEAPTFDGHHNSWIFDILIRDMDHFSECHNLSNNRKVHFFKTKLISKAQLYWEDVENCLEMRSKPPITY
jgi:hypothetical protein